MSADELEHVEESAEVEFIPISPEVHESSSEGGETIPIDETKDEKAPKGKDHVNSLKHQDSHPVDTQSLAEQTSENWKICHSSRGERYYFNSVTRQSTWELPKGVKLQQGMGSPSPPKSHLSEKTKRNEKSIVDKDKSPEKAELKYKSSKCKEDQTNRTAELQTIMDTKFIPPVTKRVLRQPSTEDLIQIVKRVLLDAPISLNLAGADLYKQAQNFLHVTTIPQDKKQEPTHQQSKPMDLEECKYFFFDQNSVCLSCYQKILPTEFATLTGNLIPKCVVCSGRTQ